MLNQPPSKTNLNIVLVAVLIAALTFSAGGGVALYSIAEALSADYTAYSASNDVLTVSSSVQETDSTEFVYNATGDASPFSGILAYESEFGNYNDAIYSFEDVTFKSGAINTDYSYSSTYYDDSSIAEIIYKDGRACTALLSANTIETAYGNDNVTISHSGGNTYTYVYDASGMPVRKYVNEVLTESYFYNAGKLSKVLNNSDNFAYEILLDDNGFPEARQQFLYFNGSFFAMAKTVFPEIPASVNSNITYDRAYSFDNEYYITQKSRGGTDYYYSYVNDIIVSEQIVTDSSNHTIDYLFDSSMNRIGFLYDGVVFYYLYDVFGNVLELLSADGQSVLTYSYDVTGQTSVSGTRQDLALVNSYAFRAKDNWHFDFATQQFYIGADIIYNAEYCKTIGSANMPLQFFENPNKYTQKNNDLLQICPGLYQSFSTSQKIQNFTIDKAAGTLEEGSLIPIKSALRFNSSSDEIDGRTDIYLKDPDNNINAQAYAVINTDNSISQVIADKFLGDLNSLRSFNYDGESFYVPGPGTISVKGHFVKYGHYVKYYSDTDCPGIIYFEIGELGNYDETYGNLYDYDNEQYLLFFGSSSANPDMVSVSNLNDEIDYEAIKNEINAEINSNDGPAYTLTELQIFYISQEYIDSLYASQTPNLILGGRTAQEMYDEFGDDWSFTYYDDELYHNSQLPDEYYDEINGFDWGEFLKKVAIGAGCILVAAAITTVTAGAGLACFAATAATLTGVSALGGVVGGAIKGAQTNSWEGFGEGFASGFEVVAITSSLVQSAGSLAGIPTLAYCFPAGTPVVMADHGFKPIQNIVAGDTVLSYNEQLDKNEPKTVVGTFQNQTDAIVRIGINGEVTEATHTHPFYTIGKGWKCAGDLNVGDAVLLSSGDTGIIDKVEIRHLDSKITVYNFEVADNHTYFVGKEGALVHNGCAVAALSGNSAGLTAADLIAVGIGGAAAGSIIAGGYVIGESIDDGIFTYPGSNLLENRGTDYSYSVVKTLIEADVIAELQRNPDNPRIYYPIVHIGSNCPTRFLASPVTKEEAKLGVLNRQSYLTLYENDARAIIEETAPLRGIPGLYAGMHGVDFALSALINDEKLPHYHYFTTQYHEKYDEKPSAHSFFLIYETL